MPDHPIFLIPDRSNRTFLRIVHDKHDRQTLGHLAAPQAAMYWWGLARGTVLTTYAVSQNQISLL